MTATRGEIIHVIGPGIPFGGAEAVVEALAAAGSEFTQVFALSQIWPKSDPPHPFVARLAERGLRVREIRCGRRKYAAESRTLVEELRTVDARVIHTHGYHSDLVAYFAARRLRIPIVATVHGYIRRSFKEHVYNVADRWMLRRFDGVIGVSPAIVQQMVDSGVAPSRVHLIPNGLSAPAHQLTRDAARAELGIPHDVRAIGWIGRLSPEKGADLLLQAVADAHIDAHTVIIGEGPELPRLQAMLDAFPETIRKRVVLAGYHGNAAGLLSAFDVLALSSRSEGTPMVILEAVAAEVPIVSFAVGGIPDLLSAEMATIVRAGDTHALGSALSSVLADRDAAHARAAHARARLKDTLSAERWLARTIEVYEMAGARSDEWSNAYADAAK